MSISTRPTRTRIAVLATSLALSLSLVAAPVVVAQDDDPTVAVQGLLDDVVAGNLAEIGGWFCAQFADQAASLDMSELAGSLPPGTDPQVVFDAFSFIVDVESMTVTSQTDDEATVNLVASLTMDVDIAGLEPLIIAILEAGGQEATPDMVTMVGGMMASEIGGESIDISEDVTVVRNEDGTWGKICSELGGDDDEMPEGEDMEAGASAEPIEATTEG